MIIFYISQSGFPGYSLIKLYEVYSSSLISSLKEFENWQNLEKITPGQGHGSLHLLPSK